MMITPLSALGYVNLDSPAMAVLLAAINPSSGPTLLGFDVIFAGTVLAAVAALAVMFAIYTALTIKDPMSKRVKALNERREQLKAGIVTSGAKKRASLARKTDTTNAVRDQLGRLNVLQQSQLEEVQQKLAHAGFRNKELAVIIIGLRAIGPIVLGAIGALLIFVVDYFPDWGQMTRLGAMAGLFFIGYKGPEIYLSNQSTKRTKEIIGHCSSIPSLKVRSVEWLMTRMCACRWMMEMVSRRARRTNNQTLANQMHGKMMKAPRCAYHQNYCCHPLRLL